MLSFEEVNSSFNIFEIYMEYMHIVSLFCVSLFSFKVTYLHLSAGEKRKFENMGS